MSAFPSLVLAAAPNDVWQSLLEILLLLGMAMILGTLAERLRQSAIVGYLIAGSIIGPSVLGLVSNQQDIFAIAELGVVLLMFAIGLEFSPRRLLSLGKTPLIAGMLQVVSTLIVGAVAGLAFGVGVSAALVIGSMIALSSTACVLRILEDRAEFDSIYGRISLGVLLIQDIAFVPLLLLVTVLTKGGTVASVLWQLTLAVASAALLVVVFYGLFNYVAPRLLQLRTWQRNRDLPILLAVVMAMGSAWFAHRLGLSPAMGAFVAGVVLAMSPFATQIRADIKPVRIILVTLFFASVGMFCDVGWLLQNLGLVIGIAMAIVLGKAVVFAVVALASGARLQFAIAAALCLAQVGEFSFVLATIAFGGGDGNGILSETAFRAIVSATIISLLVTPYLIAVAPSAGGWLERRIRRRPKDAGTDMAQGSKETASELTDDVARKRDRIFIIGFGPAGQRVAEDLILLHKNQLVVIDVNSDNFKIAKRYGLVSHLGDATQLDILEHAAIELANLVIITVPSLITSRELIHLVRHHTADAMIFAQARYHIHRWQLVRAGAHVVVDEEDQVGRELASKALIQLNEENPDLKTPAADPAKIVSGD